ncbi:hypothetical protein, partial [Mesorhizobium sp. M1C.F.Ca.ET.144.01.1.1]|uniref:hypothetical protein n=1 Tax=Mesorhizobium sp. M1C.F.Ca.ET.144.01.1.1 TaxID=2563921 RepID=UPI001AEDBBF2
VCSSDLAEAKRTTERTARAASMERPAALITCPKFGRTCISAANCPARGTTAELFAAKDRQGASSGALRHNENLYKSDLSAVGAIKKSRYENG